MSKTGSENVDLKKKICGKSSSVKGSITEDVSQSKISLSHIKLPKL
jgi:hypothetical protein